MKLLPDSWGRLAQAAAARTLAVLLLLLVAAAVPLLLLRGWVATELLAWQAHGLLAPLLAAQSVHLEAARR